MILNLLKTLPLLQLFLIVILDVRWSWWLLDVDARLDIPQPLHMHDVFLDLLTVGDDSV